MKCVSLLFLVLLIVVTGCAASPPMLGDTQVRPADEMVMVYVPGGEFVMGADRAGIKIARQLCREVSGDIAVSVCSPDVFANEQPAHPVTLTGFWIDQTEITNKQYQRCVDTGVCRAPEKIGSYTRESYFGNPAYHDHPIIWVNWQQAADYCAWAGGRLPTEAEWEYAARGPESHIFPWGNMFDGARLNYCDAGCASGVIDTRVDDGYPDTAPVGSFPDGVSWCGAQDMAGNVREWVSDWFGRYPAEAQSNPTGPLTGESRIPKGGCWLDRPDDVRSANRGENTPDYTRHKVGFRCVVDAE